MRGPRRRLRFGVVACILAAVLAWGSPLRPSPTATTTVTASPPVRSDATHPAVEVVRAARLHPPERPGRSAYRQWPAETDVRMHWGASRDTRPATERDSVAGKAVLTGLLLLGALSCWTRGSSPPDEDTKYDYESIPGGGASEGHHRRFVEGHPNYGTMLPAAGLAHGAADACRPAVANPQPPPSATEFPSGMWYGYYNHGSPVPNPFAISLNFSGGRITDVGEDVIGQFQVTGRYNSRTLRVAFSKQYIFGTGSASRNEGQLLEYRGARAPGLGQGLRGTWHMRTSRARIDGNFHIWPVMPNWNPHPPRFQPMPPIPVPAKASHTAVRIVKVKKKLHIMAGQHCALCVRRPIATVLVPCGHVAFCLPCVRELGSTCTAFCPICQVPVTQVHIEVPPSPKREANPVPGPKLLPGKEVVRSNGLRRGMESIKQQRFAYSPRVLPSSAS
eukprot:EG_transcript_5945